MELTFELSSERVAPTLNKFSQSSRKENPGLNLISEDQWNEIANTLRLTCRELQVCRLLLIGMTRLEIAEDLEIGPRTVRHYMEQLHTKLRVKNRVGLVLRLIQVRDMN